MSPAVVATAPAKVNLSLGVGPVREDGFHALATVYQAIGLVDEVSVSDADDISVSMRSSAGRDLDEVPTDASNIAVRAAHLLAECHGVERGVRIVVDKAIPVAGGMAGGSADGAAALLACDALWELRTPRRRLLDLAAELGSDVPFALVGGTAVGSGRGEVVAPLRTHGDFWWVVLESPEGLSTPRVYGEFDAGHTGRVAPPAIPEAVLSALREHRLAALGAALHNDLQEPALRLRPELRGALEQGRRSALGAVLSGSGPSCLFLCDGADHADRVAAGLRSGGLGAVWCAPGPAPGARLVTRPAGPAVAH